MNTGRLIPALGLAVLFAAAQMILPGDSHAQTPDGRSAAQQGNHFVDNDGDGYNDAAPDDDGDGIPNSKDSDYVRPGNGLMKGKRFIDEDGDGINDAAPAYGRKGKRSEANQSEDKTNAGKPEEKGIRNALQNGLKNGQNKGNGVGLEGALERGRKVGQNTREVTGIDTGAKDNAGNTSNDKGRFGREYLSNNSNFSKSSSDGGQVKDSGGSKNK